MFNVAHLFKHASDASQSETTKDARVVIVVNGYQYPVHGIHLRRDPRDPSGKGEYQLAITPGEGVADSPPAPTPAPVAPPATPAADPSSSATPAATPTPEAAAATS